MDVSIGEVARLTGLPVKTIRYHSDIGLVAAASRTDAGYRRYDEAGLARLELIHAPRDLGLDLASIRRVTERQTKIITETDEATHRAGQAVVDRAGTAVSQGLATDSAEALAIVNEVVPLFAAAANKEDSPEYRRELAHQLAKFSDHRVERYWQLIGLINGWPAQPSLMRLYEWFMAALDASL